MDETTPPLAAIEKLKAMAEQARASHIGEEQSLNRTHRMLVAATTAQTTVASVFLLTYWATGPAAGLGAAPSFVSVPGAMILGTTFGRALTTPVELVVDPAGGAVILATAIGAALTASLQLFMDPAGGARTRQRWNHELQGLEATLDRERANLSTQEVLALESKHHEAVTTP